MRGGLLAFDDRTFGTLTGLAFKAAEIVVAVVRFAPLKPHRNPAAWPCENGPREPLPVARDDERTMPDARGLSPGAPKGNKNAFKQGARQRRLRDVGADKPRSGASKEAAFIVRSDGPVRVKDKWCDFSR